MKVLNNWLSRLHDKEINIVEHQAAETNVDYSRDRVLFPVSSLDSGYTQLPRKGLIDMPEIRDGSFSNFELFAGIYVGYRILWLMR